MVTWIIGLSGSGKSTVGQSLYKLWKSDSPPTVIVDGDEIRRIFKHNIGDDPYSLEGRKINADRISNLRLWLDNQGINVVCCILSVFEESRKWNRCNYSNYLEVYLQASVETLSSRRPLYEQARLGKIKNVVGVDINFDKPKQPDLIFKTDNNGKLPDSIANEIYNKIKESN